jgi:hypothetical protein
MLSWVNMAGVETAMSPAPSSPTLTSGEIDALRQPQLSGREKALIVVGAGQGIITTTTLTYPDVNNLTLVPCVAGYLGIYNIAGSYYGGYCEAQVTALRTNGAGPYNSNDGTAYGAYTAIKGAASNGVDAHARAYAVLASFPPVAATGAVLTAPYTRYAGDADRVGPAGGAVTVALFNSSNYNLSVAQLWIGPALYAAAKIRTARVYNSLAEIRRLRGGGLFAESLIAARTLDVELQNLTYEQVYGPYGLEDLARRGKGTELVCNLQGYVTILSASLFSPQGGDPLFDGQVVHGVLSSDLTIREVTFDKTGRATRFTANFQVQEFV